MTDASGPQRVIFEGLEVVIPGLEWVASPEGPEKGPWSATTAVDVDGCIGQPRGNASSKRIQLGPWAILAAAFFLGALIGSAIVGGTLGSVLSTRPPASPSVPGGQTLSTSLASETRTESTTTTATNTSPAASSTRTSATASPTTSGAAPTLLANFEVVPPGNISTLAFGCPAQGGDKAATVHGVIFRIECYKDYLSLYDGKEAPGKIHDIAAILAYTFESCVAACVSYNVLSARLEPPRPSSLVCRAAVFRRRLAGDGPFADTGGNCFLKNATVVNEGGGWVNTDVVTGVLIPGT
ncbi:hypothetical protein GGTG_02352 [Gaeumannomyces tritici R3-111a-1]|uniref:Apple domain-containing protein n=1 Tax=Gaeumannomyces tritici (strain R3-111a-1) TaxID=644352 RepID=J3NM48_GAET3|nr:hypothetical protein GGTG_02352 [Gaeumannomyces tritici R3-111a-1]EJT82379.1 hypothetical protein GGTG_02352 [Gaeumannomyces tritici R3-111a-1]